MTEWDSNAGLSLGKFVFIPKGTFVSKGTDGLHSLLDHEYGHTIQSLILGPAYLLVVGAPSVLWFRLPFFRRMRMRTGRSYYSVVFEKTADRLGGSVSKR